MPQDARIEKTGEKLPQIRSFALVAVGSSLPFGTVDVTETITKSLQSVSDRLGVIRGQSRLYCTPAFPAGSGPDFVNAAISVETELSPLQILDVLHEIEADFGRQRDVRWAPRTLDLDLIAVGGCVLPDAEIYNHWASLPLAAQMSAAPTELVLPHPRMHERAFVLIPLADIEPDWMHPVIGKSVQQMLSNLPDKLSEGIHLL